MSGTFDINDRRTWVWAPSYPLEVPDELGECLPHETRTDAFYQRHFIAGQVRQVVEMPCAPGLKYFPQVTPGPVCGRPEDCSEAEVYDWAVSEGLIFDQRDGARA